ncbi:MAG: Tetratricopeptide 2 repeat protein [Pedosphaera sp.]|nr:Tetratricopeptide 2 repeat protein [Pedosphaera sp.]
MNSQTLYKSLAVAFALFSQLQLFASAKGAHFSFNKDIAPIIFENCSGCHRPGQSAPFNLLTYAEVKKRAKQVAEVVEKRYMPPWMPERGHGEFADERGLSPDQINIIRQWVTEGAIEGADVDLPSLPNRTEGWRLGAPDLVVKLPQPYTLSAEGKDVYRNFVFPIPMSERKYVRAVEFLPGNWKVVHHAFINVDPTRFSRRRAEKENPPGFDGMMLTETARMPGGQFLGWQPGKVPHFSPDGLGWTLEPNTDLVLQMHLHPSGRQELVQPSIGFYFTDQPPTNTAFRINLNPLIIDIPAGAKDYAIEDSYVLPIDVNLIGVSPHAHYLAKKMEGYADPPHGTRRDLILINDWDFNWQGDYRYAKPILLPKGTKLAMHFTYDNSSENVRNPNQPPKRVKYGLQTTDEMGELWFQVLPSNPWERDVLARDFYSHLGKITIDYNEYVLKGNPNDAEAHTRAGRARLYFGQLPEALNHLHAAIQANPSYDRAYYELGFIYLRQNKLPEAREAFENVVRLNADDYEAQGSLGAVYLQQGDLNQAESHFKAALRINPDDEIAAKNLERVLKAKSAK